MEAKKSALRSRKPLSDCTNKVVTASTPSRLTPSTFSSSFVKSRKSSVSSDVRSREPLSDCTNKVVTASTLSRLTPSTFSSSFTKSRKSSVSSDVKLLAGDGGNGVAGCSYGTPRTDCSEALYVPCPNELPLPASSTPVLSKQPSDNGVDDSSLEPQSFYSRRQTGSQRKHKEANIDLSSFSYTAPKVQDNKSTLKKHGYHKRPQACTVPHKKKRKKANKNALPQDFIERQRAYFAEIDAFELPEEEVESVLDLD